MNTIFGKTLTVCRIQYQKTDLKFKIFNLDFGRKFIFRQEDFSFEYIMATLFVLRSFLPLFETDYRYYCST
jgi:hypothetical protein